MSSMIDLVRAIRSVLSDEPIRLDPHQSGQYEMLTTGAQGERAGVEDPERLQEMPRYRTAVFPPVARYSLFAALGVIVLLLWHIWSLPATVAHSATALVKESKVVAVVFYGRAKYVEILDCYLQRNLVSNGGWLDEVRFLANTDDAVDIAWLDQTAARVPEYHVRHLGSKNDYLDMWATMNETETIYIKIDDDTVFIADNAIPRLVHTLQSHPEASAMSANVVNSPILQWFHYRTGAIRAYLPDPDPSPSDAPPTDWRVSSLSLHPSPPADLYPWAAPPTGPNLRMLPLENNHSALRHTPAYASDYSKSGVGWNRWEVAAQEHYSFLHNLEAGQLDAYAFGGTDATWNLHYDYMNINFLALRGADVDVDWLRRAGVWDEPGLTEGLPRARSRPVLVATGAVVVHFAYNGQRDVGFEATDCLGRYRRLAEETCGRGLGWDW